MYISRIIYCVGGEGRGGGSYKNVRGLKSRQSVDQTSSMGHIESDEYWEMRRGLKKIFKIAPDAQVYIYIYRGIFCWKRYNIRVHLA